MEDYSGVCSLSLSVSLRDCLCLSLSLFGTIVTIMPSCSSVCGFSSTCRPWPLATDACELIFKIQRLTFGIALTGITSIVRQVIQNMVVCFGVYFDALVNRLVSQLLFVGVWTLEEPRVCQQLLVWMCRSPEVTRSLDV